MMVFERSGHQATANVRLDQQGYARAGNMAQVNKRDAM